MNCCRLFVSAVALLAPTVVQALEAEPLDLVATQLSHLWGSSCVRVPLGSHEYSAAASTDSTREGLLSFGQAKDLQAGGATDAITVTFSTHAGDPVVDLPVEGGILNVELAAPDDPLIEIAADGKSACLVQGAFRDIHPTSIVPVTLDDGRPGRVYSYTYTAEWTPAVAQRYGLASRRIAAALVSFNPGAGWGQVETFRTEDEGRQFASDSFKDGGLAHFDFDASHPDRIEILEVPAGYPASMHRLTVGYVTPVPATVAACREQDHWDVASCLENLAQSGAILGALSICSRDDIRCLVDLLYASAPEEIADQCLGVQEGPRSSFSRCQAFRALHGDQVEPAEAMPNWQTAKLVGSAGTGFFLRAHSVEYGPLEELEISERRRDAGAPYLKTSCDGGQLGASMLFTAHSPLWQPGDQVDTSVRGRWSEDNDFVLEAASDGTTLTVDKTDVERFLRHAFSSESFSLTTAGATEMRTLVSIRHKMQLAA